MTSKRTLYANLGGVIEKYSTLKYFEVINTFEYTYMLYINNNKNNNK